MSMKELFIKTIEATENPNAPFILQNAHGACERLGKLFIPKAEQASVISYSEKLLRQFPADESYASDPNFLIALSGLLSVSIEYYVRGLK
jgi:hypothetical protein